MVVSKPEKMAAMAIAQNLNLQVDPKPEGPIIEEIEGLIKLYINGHVERSPKIMTCVSPYLDPHLQVNARDAYIDKVTNIWARIYVPKCNKNDKNLAIMIYFHGGGFCVGSTSWKCYHDFLGKLSSQAQCVIVSVNYRLAPEDPLPAAYEDGIEALLWVKRQAIVDETTEFWAKYCDFSRVFIGGDSAGANLAYNVALKIGTCDIKPLNVKDIILIHPFFGGQERSNSELINVQSRKSVLSLSASDTYWRLALPSGADRDHPWCNPLGKDGKKLESMRVMICVAEKDILRDRNLEFCSVLAKYLGNNVECLISQGVGHAFHVLDESSISLDCKKELFSRIVGFISKQL